MVARETDEATEKNNLPGQRPRSRIHGRNQRWRRREPGLRLMNCRRLRVDKSESHKIQRDRSEGPLATCDIHSRSSTIFPQYVAEKNLLGHPRREWYRSHF